MKTGKQYIAILFILCGTASCEKTITVKLPEEKNKIVINSHSYTGDTIKISVSKSEPILKYRFNKELSIKNAQVILYENGLAVDTLLYDASGRYISHTIAETGKLYSIKVNAPGFDEATAETMAPAIVSINSVQRNFRTRVNENGEEQDEIKIEFDDPIAAEDHYIIKIDAFNDSFGMYVCVNTTDASVEDIYNEGIDQNTCISSTGIFMRDILFNGNKKELRLYMLSNLLAFDSSSATLPKVQLLHVTKEHFKYEKSYQYGTENFGNPFAEPVNIYTNVKNGYGMFSIISVDKKDLR